MKHTTKTILLALTLLVFAAAASAEEAFIHFEQFAPGANVAGPETVHPNLDIQPLNFFGDLRVIQTFYEGGERELTVFRAPNRNPWDYQTTNSGLEDENGFKISNPSQGTARGFANTDCSWLGGDDAYWCPQEFRITFGQRRVYKFKMLMLDYGDWNPGLSVHHRLSLRGFADGVEVDDVTISYSTESPAVRLPRASSLGPAIDPKIDSDAVDSGGSGMGHKYLVVHAPPDSNGLDEIQLWASDPDVVNTDPTAACREDGCDPNVAFDSLRIGYVNLVDFHTLSCPNPLNLGGNGVLPLAVLGTAEFDVTEVMPDTCRLRRAGSRDEGAAPIRWAYDDTSRPYVAALVDEHSCTSEGPDGWDDLNLKFRNREVAAAVGDLPQGAVVHLELVCGLAGGGELRSEDVAKIVR